MRTKRKQSYCNLLQPLLLLLLITGSLGLSGCDDDDDQSVQLTASDYLDQGWELFKIYDYSGAFSSFQSSFSLDGNLSDAFNGAGWSAGRNGERDVAESNFNRCLGIEATHFDALSGLAFTLYQLGRWEESLEKADTLLTKKPGWRFRRETTLDFNDVQLMRAAANYNLGRYSASSLIVKILNNSFEPDTLTISGQRELLAEIERLRQIYG